MICCVVVFFCLPSVIQESIINIAVRLLRILIVIVVVVIIVFVVVVFLVLLVFFLSVTIC